MWKIYQCGYLADRANSWRICAQQRKVQKAPFFSFLGIVSLVGLQWLIRHRRCWKDARPDHGGLCCSAEAQPWAWPSHLGLGVTSGVTGCAEGPGTWGV